MSDFTGPLTITQTANWREWIIETPLRYEIGGLGTGRFIEVPVGFLTDGASIPRLLWWLLPTWGVYSRAAVVHDYLYDRIEAEKPNQYAPNFQAANDIFLEAMKVCGVPWLLRHLMWLAVSLFGGIKFIRELAVF